MTSRIAWLLLVSLFLLWTPAGAHTIRPAIVTVTFSPDATFQVQIETNVESILARIGTEHTDTDDSPNTRLYNEFRGLPSSELRAEFPDFVPTFVDALSATFDDRRVKLDFVRINVPDVGDLDLARKSTIFLTGKIPAGARQFVWRYPDAYGSNVLRLRYAGAEAMQSVWLRTGIVSDPFILAETIVPRSRIEVARDYVALGFTHIMPLGLDHILFVVGIFLLSLKLKTILWQVTAFTVAHTITLGMSIYGLISLSPTIVEPLIAASIVYGGVENILIGELRKWRVVIVFLFGLLHGMGFAGVLNEIGLPRSEFLTALLTFNVGVELGQLAVIGLSLAILGWFRFKPWYRAGLVIPLSALISLIGLYWTVERVL